MIVLTLSAYREHEPDQLGRTAGGWKPGLSDAKVWDNARGRWRLGPEADGHRYVLVVAGRAATDKPQVVLAVEIHALLEKDQEGLRAIEGTVLSEGHPVFDRYLGRQSPVRAYGSGPRYYTSPHIPG
ncbi:hypothetical protein [Streptacidiphilus jiangxiensis]|uniref:Uncharacterized protein n=1 Tax=Streptacidiphilus jiangxiensis TaxID=235985 RepID=A0A1H7HR65_STRJI|nr:hypothetical protein [Streptacidiphilus jiangxiensis]SEK52846.1 hypothetical protein SAMN05414137_102323 [Streptacidiphilus jiangxiensis]